MRTGLLASAALLTVAGLAAAQPPGAAPPAHLPTIAGEAPVEGLNAPAAPGGSGQPAPPAPDTPQPPAATPGNAPAPPTAAPAAGGANCAASAPAPFRDCHCGPPDATWFTVGPVLAWLKPARVPLLATSDAGAVLG